MKKNVQALFILLLALFLISIPIQIHAKTISTTNKGNVTYNKVVNVEEVFNNLSAQELCDYKAFGNTLFKSLSQANRDEYDAVIKNICMQQSNPVFKHITQSLPPNQKGSVATLLQIKEDALEQYSLEYQLTDTAQLTITPSYIVIQEVKITDEYEPISKIGCTL